MIKAYWAGLCVVGLFAMSVFVTTVHGDESAPFKVIPIPKEEHGYSNFESTVIISQTDLETFLRKLSEEQESGWNNWVDFERAIFQAKVDFERESLIFLRHTEGSGSVSVELLKPRLQGKRVICEIHRKEPPVGTADMAYYCFAVVVSKATVEEVELRVSGRKPILIKGDGHLYKEW